MGWKKPGEDEPRPVGEETSNLFAAERQRDRRKAAHAVTAKGAELLDSQRPGWHRDVDEWTLWMDPKKYRQDDRNLLEQLFGFTEQGLQTLFGGTGPEEAAAAQEYGLLATSETADDLRSSWLYLRVSKRLRAER